MAKENTTRQKKTIVFAGGGTGGHVTPIQSLIEHIDKVDTLWTEVEKVYWYGTNGSFEHRAAIKLASSCHNVSVEFVPISSGKLRRERSIKALCANFVDLFFRVPFGIIKSFLRLKKSKTDVVFCKGGYVAIPVVLAARLLRIPILVHESDTSAGLTNKIANRFASKSFTGFDNVFPGAETVGQILSSKLIQPLDGTEEYAEAFSQLSSKIAKAKKEKKTIVFVSGGSLGSQVLFTNLFKQVDQTPHLQEDFLFVVILGMLNDKSFDLSSLPKNILTIPFVTQGQMGSLMDLGDIGIVRGGTTTLAECKIFDMPLIITPLPITHDQAKNAQYYKQKYDDIVLGQDKKSFGKDLQQAILSYQGFHKEKKITNPKEDTAQKIIKITHAKKRIMETILSIK